MTATDKLRRMLDERGVEYETKDRPAANHADWEAWMYGHQFSGEIRRETLWGQPTDQNGEKLKGIYLAKATEMEGRLFLEAKLVTPEQAIDATLGREQLIDPAWEEWRDGLWHAEIKTIGDAVQQLMYETIEHGGDMGPNGNTCGGVDEGEVLTLGFINSWVAKFEALLGNDGAERSNDGVAERGTCHIVKTWSDSDYDEDWRYRCSECGCFIGVYERDPETGDVISADNYCPNCGRKVEDE